MDRHAEHRRTVAAFSNAMYDFAEGGVRAALRNALARDASVRLPHPLPEAVGSEAFYEAAYAPLLKALPDLERRDTIVVAGQTAEGADWVGCCGYYTGAFVAPWLDIPPTGHQAAMRFHEFFRFRDGKIVEVQALWDISELMVQASAWPMAPALGREWQVPSPATQDGLDDRTRDRSNTAASVKLVLDMLAAMVRHPAEGGVELMQLERYWHPRMNWYGPSGIGSARGVRGFRNWHQIPFLAAMPDRGLNRSGTKSHFFGEGNYVAVTGWPNMSQTLSDAGWLGIAPAGTKITLRSLDFWRVERCLIRENWVLIDLLDVYRQLGVDVLARLREFNKARPGFDPETGRALQ